jgi:DNA mismatch repair ATPase MutS
MPPKRSSTSQTDPSMTERGSTSGLVFSRAGICSSHAAVSRQSINRISTSTSNHFYTTADYATTISRPRTGRRNTGRPSTARPSTGVSTLGAENQEIICAISESRGVSPVLGLSFVNLDTGEAVLSQINDSQTYVRTIHKLTVFNPTTILIVSSASDPKSKLFSIIEDSLEDLDSEIRLLDRRYWAETVGLDYIQQLAFAEDRGLEDGGQRQLLCRVLFCCCMYSICAVQVTNTMLTNHRFSNMSSSHSPRRSPFGHSASSTSPPKVP